jgi:GDP-4-dehydro-6-deoxy-D-mannose reductase
MKKALITGINGSGASYLAEYLVSIGVQVSGIMRWHSSNGSGRLNIHSIKDKVKLYDCDLNDLGSTIRTLEKDKPDYIFHLAAHANVRSCFDNPIAVIQNNVNSTLNLFEAARITNVPAIIQHCSTSEVYGQVRVEDTPITEQTQLNPVNPYAVSKLAQEKIASCYYTSFGLPVIITRMFAYICPRRTDLFSSAFAKQVVEIERGQRDELIHGNLDSTRTLIDVRDMADAYWQASQKCELGVPYNMGGETIMTVGDFLEVLKSRAKVKINSRVDPNLLRPKDVTMQIPDVSRFGLKTGFKCKYSFEESLDFLLDHYRKLP